MKLTDEQLKAINDIALEELKEDDIYVFRVKAIGDNVIESRRMKVGKTALEKFVEQAKKGIPLMLNHSWAGGTDKPFTFGRSFDAELKKGDNEDNAVYVDFYIVKDITLGGENTSDIIQGIKTSTLSDVSIGFQVNDAKFVRTGKEDDGTSKGYYEITDAKLFEVSLVFSPAYDGASVQKYDDTKENVFFLSASGDVLNDTGGETLSKFLRNKTEDENKKLDEAVEDENTEEVVEDENTTNEAEDNSTDTNENEEALDESETEADNEDDGVVDITDAGGHYYSIDGAKYTAFELKMIVADGLKRREEVISFATTEAIKVNPDIDVEGLKLGFDIMSVDQILAKGNAYKQIADMEIPFGRKTESDNTKVLNTKDNSRFKL